MLGLESMQVDARGRSCPEPVLLTKKALENNPSTLEILVDSTTARDNVSRLANNSGYNVDVHKDNDEFILTIIRR